MNRVALEILKRVTKHGEVSLAAAIRMAKPRHKSHLDQYPLALLLEAGYLGSTIAHTPPTGAEEMREFSLATTLHMFTLPKNADGETHYGGTKSSGSIDPEKERVFVKARGFLYLEDQARRFWDRLWSVVLGFLGGLLLAIAVSWAKGLLRLP
jgi:hypothetical protein